MALLVQVYDYLHGIVAIFLDLPFGVCVSLYHVDLFLIKLMNLAQIISTYAP